jgi:hypothetical protein
LKKLSREKKESVKRIVKTNKIFLIIFITPSFISNMKIPFQRENQTAKLKLKSSFTTLLLVSIIFHIMEEKTHKYEGIEDDYRKIELRFSDNFFVNHLRKKVLTS